MTQKTDLETLLHLPAARAIGDDLLICGLPSAADLAAARDGGIRTIVSLCTAGECAYDEAETVRHLGMNYVNIPVKVPDSVNEDNARLLDAILEVGPTLVHCTTGNRGAALLALRAFHIAGLDPEEALAAGRLAGLTKLEPLVRERLRR